MTEDEMVGWHHRLTGHEFEQAPGDDDAQQSLACCSPWDHKESDTAEQLNNNNTMLEIPFNIVAMAIFPKLTCTFKKNSTKIPVVFLCV